MWTISALLTRKAHARAISTRFAICCLLAAPTAAAAQQELSLAEQVKKATQAKQAQSEPGQDSLAEQARKALQARETGQSAATVPAPDSLGEQARQIVAERNLLRGVQALRTRPVVPLALAVQAPPAQLQPLAVEVQSVAASVPAQGAAPAGAQFSVSQILHSRPKQPPAAGLPPATPAVQAPAAVVAEAAPVVAEQSPRPEAVASKTEWAASSTPVPPQQVDRVTLPPAGLNVQTEFRVKYVGPDVVYLIGGRSTGLAEGMKLAVKRHTDSGPTVIAELEVASVAASSAVCDVKSATGEIRAGDFAYLHELDAEMLAQTRAVGGSRKYPQVVTFSEGDPLDEEAREEIPRPPLPEVNRARGRIGLDYSGISSRGSVASSSYQIGGVMRADFTRIGGTYWNLSGYWRGRFTNRSSDGQPTLQDLINRTYHLSLMYDSPKSAWVAGFGRLYLPWATSLDTIDGGYFGRRLGHGATAGVFAGSTPDPTSWDYNPDRRIAGTFLNFEGGSFDSVHYTSTTGLALSSLGWVLDRPFAFFENGIFFKRYLSVYQSAQVDDPRPAPGITRPGPGLSRSYTTIRIQPHRRISFDINHNYFRDVPTFSQQLISTGLVDKYLFQGLSAGVRVEPVRHITLYTDIGRSDRTGDQKTSINQLYGITWDRIWKTGLRADVRASKFDSSFGSGNYRSLALSRTFAERLHWQVQAGQQTLTSSFTSQGTSRFVNSSLDASFGGHYFLQGDFTAQRGAAYDYDQWILTLGYRFDNRTKPGAAR